jgi:O-antigen/teichoic acid export membrane protein
MSGFAASLKQHQEPGKTSAGGHRVLTNALANWLGFAVTAVVVFFMSPILVRGLGDARYGVWSLIESILAYLALCDLGIGAAVLRYVARFEGLGDRDRLNRVFSTSLAIFAAMGGVALLATLVLAFAWARPLGVPESLAEDTRWLLVLLGLNLAVGLPFSVYEAALTGLGHYPTNTVLRLSSLLARSGLLLVVLNLDGGLKAIGLVITACSLGQNLATALVTHHYLPSLRFSSRFVDRETFRTIWGFSIYVFIALVAGRVSFRSDAIVIGLFLLPQNITYFMIAIRLVEYSREAITSLTSVLTPAVSNWEAQGNHRAIQSVLTDGTRLVLFLAVLLQIGLLLFGYPFIQLWMGPGYADQSYVTLAILVAPLPLSVSLSVALRILQGLARLKFFTALTVVQAVLNLGLSIALVLPLGIEGVAWGTSVPHVLHCLAVTVYVCRVVEIPVGSYFLHAYGKPLLASSVALAAWWLGLHWLPPLSWRALIEASCLGFAPYVLAMAALEPRFRGVLWRGWSTFRTRASEITKTDGNDLGGSGAAALSLVPAADLLDVNSEIRDLIPESTGGEKG